ncbi:MAG: YigZ family protein [Ignavibacteria bacterium]
MILPEEYTTIGTYSEIKLKERSSVFIGMCYPVNSEEEVSGILETIRKKYYDATHHCYAYSLINGIFKYSDDGEPSGTAGLRIYNAIQHFSLMNLLVIIVRYFGGTKLGVGPLGKAYYESAFLTIDQSVKIKKTAFVKYEIRFNFNLTSRVHYILSKLKAKITSTTYEDSVCIEAFIKLSETKRLCQFVAEDLKGEVALTDNKEICFI